VGNPRKHKWVVRTYRLGRGVFINGEREIYRVNTDKVTFRTLRTARENSAKGFFIDLSIARLAGNINEKQRRVVELQIWPDNPDE
jgi:hypothetical protein